MLCRNGLLHHLPARRFPSTVGRLLLCFCPGPPGQMYVNLEGVLPIKLSLLEKVSRKTFIFRVSIVLDETKCKARCNCIFLSLRSEKKSRGKILFVGMRQRRVNKRRRHLKARQQQSSGGGTKDSFWGDDFGPHLLIGLPLLHTRVRCVHNENILFSIELGGDGTKIENPFRICF